MFSGAALAALTAVVLRVAGIGWGLPGTYNADEPHIIHLAVSFGAGTLRPYAFKYPTLWPYVLFSSYGLFFLGWSGFGLRKGLKDFAGLYAWNQGSFILIGRLLASAASLAGCWALWRAEKWRHPDRLPWASLLLAFCPLVVDLAHSAKPDCFMLMWATLGWIFALEVYENGSRRAHWLSGAFFGLAMSSQYTALPAALALPVASVLSKQKVSLRTTAEGLLCAGGFFLIGSPYILLDFRRFAESLGDLKKMAALEPWDRKHVMRVVLMNMLTFAGPGSIAGFASLVGAALLVRAERALAAVFLIPLCAYFVVVGNNPDGGWARYILGGFPALALLAAEGLSLAKGRPAVFVVGILALGPGVLRSALTDLEYRKPDTREAAAAWIAQHVPPGGTLLLDEPHASPNLPMAKEQALELEQRSKEAGSPRARLYRALAETHQGGGYRLLRIKRSAADLRSGPEHVERTQAETAALDVRPGLDVARAQRVDYVVTSSYGARPDRAKELGGFFQELHRDAALVATFSPEPGKTAGPVLRIFALKKAR